MFILIGIAFVAGGYIWYQQNQRWKKAALRVMGQVLSLQQDRDSDGQTFWFATIGFTAGGQSHQFRDAASVNPKIYAVGSTHPVLYSPQKPADARLARD